MTNGKIIQDIQDNIKNMLKVIEMIDILFMPITKLTKSKNITKEGAVKAKMDASQYLTKCGFNTLKANLMEIKDNFQELQEYIW